MPLSPITSMNQGFPQKPTDLFKQKCHAYLAKGDFSTTDIPENIADLTDLYTGINPKFKPIGVLDNAGSNVTWSQKTAKTDFHTIGMGTELTATLVLLTISEDTIDFTADIGDDEYSILFIPQGTNNIFYALSGVTLTTEGNIGIVDGDNFAKITLKAFREANKLTDILIFKTLQP